MKNKLSILPPPPAKIAARRLSLKKTLFLSVLLLFLLPTALLLTTCGGGDIKLPKPKAWHVTTLAGSGASGNVDGIGTAATFSVPYGVEQIGTTLYVTDIGRNNIRTIDINTTRVGTIVKANSSSGHAVGDGTTARFNRPRGIVARADGMLYVADHTNRLIRLVSVGATAAATQVSDFAGQATIRGNDDNATGTSATFRGPCGLALSEDGNKLYVSDYISHRIRVIDLASTNKAVSTIAGSASGVTGEYADGAGNTARFRRPCGLAVSGTTLYVADSENHRIRAIDLASANNTVSTIAGSGTPGAPNGAYANGAGATARFNTPIDITLSKTTLYVTDTNNHRIRAIDLASANKTVSTIAGDGTGESTNGIGTAAQFNSPQGITVSRDTLYVTTDGRRIRKLEYR